MNAVLVLHGPNLNLLGQREPEIYGRITLEEINLRLVKMGEQAGMAVRTFQSNSEGDLIDALQEARSWAGGVIFNPGGYTHTSIALRDTISALDIPVIEVHLSNIFARETFRHTSLTGAAAAGGVHGLGWRSYTLAMQALIEIIQEREQSA